MFVGRLRHEIRCLCFNIRIFRGAPEGTIFDTRSVEEGLFGDSSRGHARRDSSSTSAACVALTPCLASSAASQVSHSLTVSLFF